MDKDNELVLCVPRTDINGFTRKPISFENASFRRRGSVENNPAYQQIIPYIVVRNDNGKILTYKRGKKGGETRLHDYYSIGIGGHVNIKDFYKSYDRTIENAVYREVKEELELDVDKDFEFLIYLGWFACNNTKVDEVHLGLLCTLQITNQGLNKILEEKEVIEDIEFLPIEEIKKLNLESWSKIALEVIEGVQF